MPDLTPEDIKRFWNKVHRGGIDDCWEWIGSSHKGYGRFKIRGYAYFSHRISWIINNGKIPFNMLVCHKCDNPPCCNPNHLFVGTNQDNTDDMIIKKRYHKSKHSLIKYHDKN